MTNRLDHQYVNNKHRQTYSFCFKHDILPDDSRTFYNYNDGHNSETKKHTGTFRFLNSYQVFSELEKITFPNCPLRLSVYNA